MTDNRPMTPWQLFASEDRMKRYCELARVRPPTLEGRFEAAVLTFPEFELHQLAHKAAAEYPYHPFVIDELARLATVEPVDNLPTREQQARDVYNLASDLTKSIDDRLKAHKLYADMMGHVQKPGTGTGDTYNIDQRRVMYFPMTPRTPEDIEAWERRAERQQETLIAHAAR